MLLVPGLIGLNLNAMFYFSSMLSNHSQVEGEYIKDLKSKKKGATTFGKATLSIIGLIMILIISDTQPNE
jgi:hypothetical protein